MLNKKKYLTIIACNTDSEIKLKSSINNLKYFMFPSNDIIVIDSENVKYGETLKTQIIDKIMAYYTIPNNKFIDFGKWSYILQNYNYSNYDYVIFTNDSYIIKAPIYHFYNLVTTKNVDLYGYNNSSQDKFHYQSYLFAIRSSKCNIIPLLLDTYKHLIFDMPSLIKYTELQLAEKFTNKDCFLKIITEPHTLGINLSIINRNICMNIFFNNDKLYSKLYNSKLLPFIKIKRLLGKS